MRRITALLASVAAVLVAVAQPAAADPGVPASPNANPPAATSVPADALGLSLAQVAGSGLAVTLDAGASEEHDLVVSNHTANLRLTVKLSATDATGNLGTAAASWLAFGDDEIQLDPHVPTTVPMTIAVPHDTQPSSALAHVSATVENAVSAADGSPVAGTATQTFPVAISVQGTPTAQIAIADVHRVDKGSRHELAVVLRNFGDQGAQVSGHVVIAGDQPQTLPFHADLGASRDTTVDLPWHAPPAGSASDIAVDLEYGGGNVASWSSRLGGAPTDLSPVTAASPTTVADTSAAHDAGRGLGRAATPWWKQPLVALLAALALLGAAVWFGFEMLASRRRRGRVRCRSGRVRGHAAGLDADVERGVDRPRQATRAPHRRCGATRHRASRGDAPRRTGHRRQPGAARSPGADLGVPERVAAAQPEPAPLELVTPSPFEPEAVQSAAPGPAPPAAVPVAEPAHVQEIQPEVLRPTSETPGAPARPEPVVEPLVVPAMEALVVPAEPEPNRTRTLAEPEPEPEPEPDPIRRRTHGAIVGARSRAPAATRMDGRRRVGCRHRTAARAAAVRRLGDSRRTTAPGGPSV